LAGLTVFAFASAIRRIALHSAYHLAVMVDDAEQGITGRARRGPD